MVDWEKFNETSLLEKKDSYSDLNMEDITDADHAHAKNIEYLMSGIAQKAALKEIRVKQSLLFDVELLLIVEKWVKDGIYQAIH